MGLHLSNKALIIATQRVPRSLIGARNRFRRTPEPLSCVKDIDQFVPNGHSRRRALILLSPSAWHIALREYPRIRMFNFVGLTFELVKSLNRRGYTVDIVDYRDPILPTDSNYDLVVAHGSKCRTILESLPPRTFVIQYASGAYWQAFNQMSRERYDDFCIRRNLPPIERFVRSLEGQEEGEEFLARRANATFVPGPRTLATWQGVSQRLAMLYLGAYLERDLLVDHDYEAGRRNFLYAAGTGGNIQKGLDILLEAFGGNQDHHLYIYCKVEDEVLHAYDDIFRQPNVHYVYHLRLRPFRKMMSSLMKNINYTISAPIDTGTGTAFTGTLGLGLIPVGYVDIDASPEESCMSASWKVDAITSVIREASQKPVAWYQKASLLAIARYRRFHDPTVFGERFDNFLDDVLV